MADKSEWQWFGSPGHFICAHYCRFHLCTRVGDYLVSTVGEYLPPESIRELFARSRGVELVGIGDRREADYINRVGYEPLGAAFGDEKPLYETMVFKCGPVCARPDCMCGQPTIDGCELYGRRVSLRGDANKEHLSACERCAAGDIEQGDE